MQSTATERTYLTRLLRAFITGGSAPTTTGPIGWDRFQLVLRSNGLTPIFHHCAGRVGIPPEVVEASRRVALRSLARNGVYTRATVRLFAMLEDASVPALALRGVVLSHSIYDDPLLRPMTDVDVLVAKRSAPRIVAALGQHGYTPVTISRNQLVYRIDGCKMEIHWNLIKRILPRDFEPWIATRRRLTTSHGDLFGLSPSHELIALVCHGFIHHDVDTLLKVVDIALLCHKEPVDWPYVRAWCTRQSLDRIFAFTFGLTDHLLGTRLHAELGVGKPYGSSTDRIFESYATRLFGHDRRRDLLRRRMNFLRLAQGTRAKLRMLRRFLRNRDLQNLVTPGFDTRRAFQRS